MIDPELKKLLEELEPEDLKDLAALHGAGSFERQADAQLRKQAAEVFPILVVIAGPFLFAAFMVCSAVVLAGIRFLLQSIGIPLP